MKLLVLRNPKESFGFLHGEAFQGNCVCPKGRQCWSCRWSSRDRSRCWVSDRAGTRKNELENPLHLGIFNWKCKFLLLFLWLHQSLVPAQSPSQEKCARGDNYDLNFWCSKYLRSLWWEKDKSKTGLQKQECGLVDQAGVAGKGTQQVVSGLKQEFLSQFLGKMNNFNLNSAVLSWDFETAPFFWLLSEAETIRN